jgi:hypothetical protein
MNKIKAILLAMAMVVTLSGLALAQGNYDDRNRDYRDRGNNDYRGNHQDNDNYTWGQNRNNDAREYGFHNGYRDGWNQGRAARMRRGSYNYGGSSDTNGYNRYMGPRGQYKQGYREGYRVGYSDAFYSRRSQYSYTYGQNGNRTPWDPDGDGRPGYSNNGGYYGNNNNYNNGYNNGNGSASQWGYRDGLAAGQKDRSTGHSYRPTEWAAYRDADHGMSSSTGYGSSDQYKQEYRQSFMNGYQQGYGRR